MPAIRLIQITREGAPAEAVADLPEVALKACAFTAAPVAGRVEIAYFTFPSFEGRGVATEMATQLISIARMTQPAIEVFAQTLPERNASNSILKKLGFELFGQANHPEEGPVWEWRLAPKEI